MNASLQFLLVNQSTSQDPALGGVLDDVTLTHIAAVLEEQLNVHVAYEWGGAYHVRSGPLDGIQAVETAVLIRDNSNVEGAAGYHNVLPNGCPIIFVFRSGSNSLATGSEALSVTLSHELIETAIDPGCNRWADAPNGTQVALEGADAVETNSYSIDGVSVSDFLLQAFFVPGAVGPYAVGPYSHMNIPTAPFVTPNSGGGNYQIVRKVTDQGIQVMAEGTMIAGHHERKRHVSSRTYGRMGRLDNWWLAAAT